MTVEAKWDGIAADELAALPQVGTFLRVVRRTTMPMTGRHEGRYDVAVDLEPMRELDPIDGPSDRLRWLLTTYGEGGTQ